MKAVCTRPAVVSFNLGFIDDSSGAMSLFFPGNMCVATPLVARSSNKIITHI
jgi:hypothetical protein